MAPLVLEESSGLWLEETSGAEEELELSQARTAPARLRLHT